METKNDKPLVVAIDGPAAAGKSTVARLTAEKLGLPYLDTGSIYRAIAWWLDNLGISCGDTAGIVRALEGFSADLSGGCVLVNGRDVTNEIRTPKIDKIVSPVSGLKCVRDSLLSIQRGMARGGVVADGRDIGTVVLPDADLKIFLTASAEERAGRRCKERLERGENADYNEILKQINERDDADMHREISPLRPALGAVILDTTGMTIEEAVGVITDLAKELRGNAGVGQAEK